VTTLRKTDWTWGRLGTIVWAEWGICAEVAGALARVLVKQERSEGWGDIKKEVTHWMHECHYDLGSREEGRGESQ
jgi:hypothetical protein